MFNENFKDTYVALNGAVRYFGKNTKIETENEVILKKLSPLCVGETSDAIESIRFLSLAVAEKEKIEKRCESLLHFLIFRCIIKEKGCLYWRKRI